MKKYHVYGKLIAWVSIEVEAETAEDAVEKAYEEFGGVNSYVGNGGYDKLIGVTNRNESIESDGEVDWEKPEEVE